MPGLRASLRRIIGELPVAVRYKEANAARDKRCAYTNAKWPFIIEVSAFMHDAKEPRKSVDAARFRVGRPDPSSFHQTVNPGAYVVWWSWRGYYDCIDVDVVAGTDEVEHPYGEAAVATDEYTRVDHCAFRQEKILENRCIEVVDDLEVCMHACSSHNTGDNRCDGVQVAPLVLPDTVHPAHRSFPLLPLSLDNQALLDPQTGEKLPFCKGPSFLANDERWDDAARAKLLICMSVVAIEASETQDILTTTEDFEDPVYYGTCLRRSAGGRNFLGTATSASTPNAPINFRSRGGASCLSCEQKAFHEKFTSPLPLWAPSKGVCVSCDLEPATTQPALTTDDPVVSFGVERPALSVLQVDWTKVPGSNNDFCRFDGAHGNNHTCGESRGVDFCMRSLGHVGARTYNGL